MTKRNSYKIFSDPVHGFINVPRGLILTTIDHPYLQRLRRIRQLGLGYLVFPGAEHTRFSHAIGAMGLMQMVLNNLKEKNTTISSPEYDGTLLAVLLHDIGHGPFSHTLEHTFFQKFNHENMTLALMRKLNEDFNGELETAIQIFTDEYHKPFLHQLISSQLDIDRLDYLKRDSFYTGVSEGSVGINRILKTMRVFNGNIVIEKKGIYAVENYILARRLMYMQVYLHKTVLAADKLLRAILKRAKYLLQDGQPLFIASPALEYFLRKHNLEFKDINNTTLEMFTTMEDNDILMSVKYWQQSKDAILADLANRFLNRKLFRTTFVSKESDANMVEKLSEKTRKYLKKSNLPYGDDSLKYYLHFDKSYSEAYRYKHESIWILHENDEAVEFSKSADTSNIIALTEPVVKPYYVHLKEIDDL